MFSSILHKKLPAEAGISVVCVSPGVVQTDFVSFLKIRSSSFSVSPNASLFVNRKFYYKAGEGSFQDCSSRHSDVSLL